VIGSGAEFYVIRRRASSLVTHVDRRHVLIVGIVVVGAPFLALWLAQENPPPRDSEEPPGTQIVVQWLDNSPVDSSTRADPLLDLLYMRSQDLYVVDSFDLGSGTMDIFLYSADPESAVRRVIELFDQGLLRPGMRIGLATSQGGDQGSRTYRPVYPPGLKEFRLIYPSENALKNRGG
jgi:hypothetical protein